MRVSNWLRAKNRKGTAVQQSPWLLPRLLPDEGSLPWSLDKTKSVHPIQKFHQDGSVVHRLVVSPQSSRLLKWSCASHRPRNSRQTPSERHIRNFPSCVCWIGASPHGNLISSIIWKSIFISLVESNFDCASNDTQFNLCWNELIGQYCLAACIRESIRPMENQAYSWLAMRLITNSSKALS